MSAAAAPQAIVDETHCGRHVTGIERITLELFSQQALKPFQVRAVRSPSRKRMVLDQNIILPLRSMQNPGALVLCSGFPPAPLLAMRGRRVVTYIHDLFLLTRPADLNWRARAYMAPSLRFALRRLRNFLVNSQATLDELRRFARADATIRLYRPQVRNVLGLSPTDRSARAGGGPRLVALGTIEPRKNLAAAAQIVAALRDRGAPEATLDLIGREGWGGEAEKLRGLPGVTLRGYLPPDEIQRIVDGADMLISTSHAEGLGLPLLEAQYSALPIAAPDQPVFREALADSGLFISSSDPGAAADRILAALRTGEARRRAAAASIANIERWNAQAREDHAATIAWLTELAREL